MPEDVADLQDVPIVTQPVEDRLGERELADYRDYKTRLLDWLYHVGKDPDRAEGYAEATVRQVSCVTDEFYRWLWDERGGYTTTFEGDAADDYMERLVYADEAHSTGCVQKCLRRLFKWRRHVLGMADAWNPEYSFSAEQRHPRDFLTVDERTQIPEAALDYGNITSYNRHCDCSPTSTR